MNGAEYLVQQLLQRGVDCLFGYPGGCIMPFYDALIDSPLKHILCRHEQGAAFAANGYARASGRPGICIATSGPGATNLITGLADAQMDSIPMIAITGQVPTPLIGTDAFQEIDVLGLSLSVTKQSFLVERIEDLPAILDQAFTIATSGRPGPVLIDLPKDIQLAKLGRSAAETGHPQEPLAVQPLPHEALAKARRMMEASRRPILYAGGGIVLGDAVDAFRRFAETTGIPSVQTLKGIGTLPAGHPLNLGMLGMHGNAEANRLVQQSDLLIAIGARFDDRVTGRLDRFAPDAAVIHLDIDPAEIDKLRRANCSIAGEVRPGLEALTAPLPQNLDGWRQECRMRLERELDRERAARPDGLTPQRVLEQLAELAGPDAIVCSDVGQHQMWIARHYPVHQPRNHLSSGGLGAMGFGLPAAIGAQFSQPDSTVINIAGDGSVMMNLQELATLARYHIPVKVLVLDNQALGMVRQQQAVCYAGRFTEVDLQDNPEFSELARAFGLAAWRIDTPGELSQAIDRWLRIPGPALLHIPIDTRHAAWPMVRPGDSNDQMITGVRQ